MAIRSPYRVDETARDVLHLSLPANSDVQVGDPLVIVQDGTVLGAGQIVTLAAVDAACQLYWLELALPDDGTAWVVPAKRVAQLSDSLPPTVVAKSGGDANSAPKAVDQPTRWRAVIRDVSGPASGKIIKLHDSADGPAGVGDRLDIYRGPDYLGFAKIIQAGLGGVQAEQLEAMSRGVAQAGDVVVRRPPSGTGQPSPGYVFRREGSHALISLGEADGIRRGQVLTGRGADGANMLLRVDRTYPDHCGAEIVPKPDGPLGEINKGSPVWPGAMGPLLVGVSPENWHQAGGADFFWIHNQPLDRQLRAGNFVMAGGVSHQVGVIIEVGSGWALGYTPGVWHLWGPGAGNYGQNSRRQTTVDTGFEQPAPAAPAE